MDSRPGTQVLTVIRIVVNLSVSKISQSFACHSAVERAVWNGLDETRAANEVTTGRIELSVCTVAVIKLDRNAVEKRCIESREMVRYRNVSDKAVLSYKKNAEDKLLSYKTDLVRCTSPLSDISGDKGTILTAYSSYTFSEDFNICRNYRGS